MIYALFPQDILDWGADSPNFFAFWIYVYLIILLLAHKLCAGSPPQKFQLLFHLEVSPSKSKSKRNENISSCNKKLLKFEEYGRASVAFWQIRKHEIALFCSGQTEPYATTLALATL